MDRVAGWSTPGSSTLGRRPLIGAGALRKWCGGLDTREPLIGPSPPGHRPKRLTGGTQAPPLTRMRVRMDTLTPIERSARMARVRSRDTRPELRVRRAAHALGFRYRLHSRELPGSPDLVFQGRRIALFVHGCFWHRHGSCPLTRWPKSRLEFWRPKLEANRARDERVAVSLGELGWRPVVIWECETLAPHRLKEILVARLGP